MLCLVQLKQMKRMQGQDAEKLLLSERKVLNAILRLKLKYMKDVFFLHEMKCYLQCRKQISCVRNFFAEQVMLELQCTESLVFRASKNTNAVLVQLSKWRECKATGCWKASSQWEKVAKCNFRVTLKYMKDCFFLMNEMLFAMQKTDFMC